MLQVAGSNATSKVQMPPQKCILANAAGAGRALHAGLVVKSLVVQGQGYVNSHTLPSFASQTQLADLGVRLPSSHPCKVPWLGAALG